MKNIKLISSGGIILAVVLLLAVNILSSVIFKWARVDLTENKLYTLSQGTKNILQSFDEPITLRFYFSEKLTTGIPRISNYGRRIRELLEEYAAVSDGNVQLIILDPEPFSEEEDQAVQHGLQGIPIDSAGSVAYFGLVGTNATDSKEIIAFFQAEKEASLEYDITRLAYKLGNPKKRVVGLLSTLPIEGPPFNPMMMQNPQANHPWMIVSQLRQSFDVRSLAKDVDAISNDIDVLMLVHPKELSDKTLFAIDQFVLGGGHALIFVDPHAESDKPAADPQNPMAAMMASRASDLKKLFDAWGIEMVPGQLAADIDAAVRVNVSQGGRPQTIEYVLWLQLKDKNLAEKDFVTSGLKEITMASAGYLKSKKDATTKMTPLIETGSRAMSIPATRIRFQPNPQALLDSYRPGNEKLTIAARLTGPVKTAFPDGPPEGVPQDKKDTWFKQSQAPINIIVIADADMLEDRYWVNIQNFFGHRIAVPRSNNGVLVMNAIENLSGSNDLISLRSRGNYSRPFEKVKELQREAEKSFREREKLLQTKLKETEQKIRELQRQKSSDSALILSPEQQNEITNFRQEQAKTRKDLRNVQHELRKNIESLGSTLKFINIALIPILITILAIVLGVYRHRRMDRLVGPG